MGVVVLALMASVAIVAVQAAAGPQGPVAPTPFAPGAVIQNLADAYAGAPSASMRTGASGLTILTADAASSGKSTAGVEVIQSDTGVGSVAQAAAAISMRVVLHNQP